MFQKPQRSRHFFLAFDPVDKLLQAAPDAYAHKTTILALPHVHDAVCQAPQLWILDLSVIEVREGENDFDDVLVLRLECFRVQLRPGREAISA